MSKTKKITLSAVLVALSFALVVVSKLIPAPWMQGGSVTIASMVPIILASLLLGTKWGLACGLAFSLIQMMTGFYPPPTQNFISFIAVIFLDYVGAFSVLGLANLFVKLMGSKSWAIPLSGTIVTGLRFIMHILSGILIWGVYAEGSSVLVYSITYNGSYMIPEMIITTIVLAILTPKLKGKYTI